MKLYVPVPGDRLNLTSDWTFTVHSDHNNWWFINALGLPHVRTQQCTLPAGTKLAVSYWNVEGNRKHWDHVVLRLLERKSDFSVGTSDIELIDCDVSKPTYRPRRALGDWFDYENDLNEYLLDEEEETDWRRSGRMTTKKKTSLTRIGTTSGMVGTTRSIRQ